MIRHLGLFAGIGGFELAARWTGVVETVGLCEIDPWCQRVLAKHWPGVPIHDDITTLAGDALARFGPIDFITGGFPCQPYSVAGKRGGAEDDRALWPAMAAVIAESRPAYVLAENVPGIVSMELDLCLADLEALGYACRSVIVPALGVDAPHKRERVWVLAHAEGITEREPIHQSVPVGGGGDAWLGTQASGDRLPFGESDQIVADSNSGRRREQVRTDTASRPLPTTIGEESASGAGSSGEALDDSSSGRHGLPEEAVRAGRDGVEHASRWLPEPNVGRILNGLPTELDKHRLRGLGNAIVPQVAYELMRVMFADEMGEAA
jgi:DNA (cytosine-5)-methyltransferase 1